MDEETLKELKKINVIKDFIDFLKPYYPNLDIKNYSIEEIERALYHIFIKLIGKIISISPNRMRSFLKDYLLVYEIMNLKQIILGAIVGMTKEEKANNVNFLVEEYLENIDFVRGLLEIRTLDEIQLYMKGTKYYKAVREGLLYFKNNNEIFVLEAYLDQLYFLTLVNKKKHLSKNEKKIVALYIDVVTEIYNLNMIYRGIKNNIDKKLLAQFLVNNYLFLDEEKVNLILQQENLDDFFSSIEIIFQNTDEIKKFVESLDPIRQHFVWWIGGVYMNYFFSRFKQKIDSIEYSTIFKIIEIIIRKNKEIQFDILPNVIKIINDKFEIMEKASRD
jgi:V/A-type H+-transporting ATPase subunit C